MADCAIFPGGAIDVPLGRKLDKQDRTHPVRDNRYSFLDTSELRELNETIVRCRLCPRLVAHREAMGETQRKAYRGQIYWSKPLPGFGDPAARLMIAGLAPGAHGANRTGRMFTGDRSGEFLYRALFETGFANQPQSVSSNDGLKLTDAYITAAVRCAPPDNKPSLEELRVCRGYLTRELALMRQVRAVVVLGRIAFDSYLCVLQERGLIRSRAPFRFAHGAEFFPAAGDPPVIASYHPSQQNTSTGKQTAKMLREIFERVRHILSAE